MYDSFKLTRRTEGRDLRCIFRLDVDARKRPVSYCLPRINVARLSVVKIHSPPERRNYVESRGPRGEEKKLRLSWKLHSIINDRSRVVGLNSTIRVYRVGGRTDSKRRASSDTKTREFDPVARSIFATCSAIFYPRFLAMCTDTFVTTLFSVDSLISRAFFTFSLILRRWKKKITVLRIVRWEKCFDQLNRDDDRFERF